MKIERVAIGRFMEVKDRVESGRIMEIEATTTLEVQDSLAMKEGVYFTGYQLAKIMTPNTASKCHNRRGVWKNKGKGKGKGKGKDKGVGNFEFEDMIYTEIAIIPDMNCPNPLCRTRLIDGYLQCPMCNQEIGTMV